MKYCSHCGNELVDEAVICPKCGCAAENYSAQARTNNQSGSLSTLAIIGFIFAFIESLVGLVCSIIAYKNAIAENDEKSKNFAKIGIIISAVLLGVGAVSVIVVSIFYGLIFAAGAGGIVT